MKTKYKKSELSSVKSIVFSAFEQMEEKLDCRIPKSFFLIVMLFLSIKGKINFLQLERFSGKYEQRFRYFFEQSFDFLVFNKTLITMNINGKTALAFDPSFITKAGKRTPGVGYFWSGCAGKTKMALLDSKSAQEVKEKAVKTLQEWKPFLHTITSDNGKEFANHKEISSELNIEYYFAKPYHSWERGANENYNGLVRQYFPKDYDFNLITEEKLLEVENKLNDKPRKRFGYLTPNQVYSQKIINNGKIAFIT